MYLDPHLAHVHMSKVTPCTSRGLRGHCSEPLGVCANLFGRLRGAQWRTPSGSFCPQGGGTGHTHGPAGGVASQPRPRLLARCQTSPASPPSYKRRDRGAPASLRQQPAGRAGFRRVPVRLPAAASVTPVSGADGRRREPWELQPSRSRQVWGAWVGAGTAAPPLAPAQTPGAPRTRVSAAALGSVRLASARASAGRSGRPRRWRQREVAPSKFLQGTGSPAPPLQWARVGGGAVGAERAWEQSGAGGASRVHGRGRTLYRGV